MTTATGGSPAPAISRTYLGWQQEKVAFLFGMSGRRAAMLGLAVLSAIWPLAASAMTEGIVCWPAAVVLAVLAFARIAGRTADEWIAAFASYNLAVARGQHKFAAAAFSPPAKAAPADPPPMDLPGILAPLQILEADGGNGTMIGIAVNRRERTFTAVARIGYPGIGLVDSSRRDLRVAGWGSLLSGLCTEGNPVVRVQALQRLVPESGSALRRWHADHLAPDAPAAAAEITSALLSTSTLATSQREAYLAFTMDARRAGPAIKAAGGGDKGAAIVLLRHVRSLTAAISGAGLQVESWLGPRDLAEVLRTAFDPHSARGWLTGEQTLRRPSPAAASPTHCLALIPASPGPPLQRRNRAATSTTAQSRPLTGCMTGPAARCTRPRSPRCSGKAGTAAHSPCTSSRSARGPPNRR
jgi:Putative type VII ESX secretion system translocon, EccE